MGILPISSYLRQYAGTQCCNMMSLMSLSLFLLLWPMSAGMKCPSSCSTISPLPYPFGAAPGCGSPGFLLTDCSIPLPQWNITTAAYTSSYYIKSISSNPNTSYPQRGTVLSYGYGGTVLVDVKPSYKSTCFVLNASSSAMNNFISSDFYAFQYADLTYYQDSYLFFNCSVTSGVPPPSSGVLKFSSPTCTKFMDYCNLSSNGSCIEFLPDKQLQLSTFRSIYDCSTRKRFVISDPNEDVSMWKQYTQFAWGPVRDAEKCSACQGTGGMCGYNIQDNSFLCYCGDEARKTDCSSGRNLKAVYIGLCLAFLPLIIAGITFYFRHKLYYWQVCGNRERRKLDSINQAPLELSYWALSAATKSFSMLIGQGAFGKVYRGLLNNGSEVAVKVLDCAVLHTDEQFLNEVATIGNIHHMHVARLVGYCFRTSKRMLVYEYVSNGSLDKYLFSKKEAPGVLVLSWKQRFGIALGVARGLCYMHEECRNCIIHCDIKPQNILLDAAYSPKIADFGLARLLKTDESRVLTHARGTPGYVAPEFWSLGSGPLSTKFDVYSYGMVLLEIIRGRRSFKEFDPFSKEEEAEVSTFVSVAIDERIEHDVDMEQAQLCTQVALWCIQEDPSMRPTMSRVVQVLQGAAAVPDKLPRPFQTAFRKYGDGSESSSRSSYSLLSHTLSRD